MTADTRDLDRLDALIRQPGSLAALPPPAPLHKMTNLFSPENDQPVQPERRKP